MPSAHEIMTDYFDRVGRPPASQVDAVYQFQMSVVTETATRLDVIMMDEQIPASIRARVIRGLLYGAPSPAEAMLRRRIADDEIERLTREPSVVMNITDSLAGLRDRLHQG